MRSIHDNIVHGYSVSFTARTVRLYTSYQNKELTERTDVLFTGVVTHQFYDMLVGSAILNRIIDAHPMQFYEDYRTIFAPEDVGGITHSSSQVPFRYRDVGEFTAGILERGLSCFEVTSSYGMHGFVIAERMELIEVQPIDLSR